MNAANENNPTAAPPAPCPTCGKPAAAAYRPFCSKRCTDVDLHRWLAGRYAIPVSGADEQPDEEDEEEGREG